MGNEYDHGGNNPFKSGGFMSGASLTDILTTQKNGVVAINNLNTTLSSIDASLANLLGEATVTVVAATSRLVRVGSGMVSSAICLVAGSTDTYIYDAISVANADTTNYTNCIAIIQKTHSPNGNYPLNAYYSNGLVVVTGTGHIVSVTYSITA